MIKLSVEDVSVPRGHTASFQAKERLLEWAAEYEYRSPQEILRIAIERIPSLVFACSFGAEDVALLDMIVGIKKDQPIFYLDTNVLFAQTYALRDEIIQRYHPNLIAVQPELTLAEQAQVHGDRLWAREPDRCCDIRKVRPLQNILGQYDGWITGIRREQSPTRAHAQVFEWDQKFDMVKVNPLALWTDGQVWKYIKDHDVPYNPLHDEGYPSIGCIHCTRPVAPGEDPRSGRWAGFAKTECGLHK